MWRKTNSTHQLEQTMKHGGDGTIKVGQDGPTIISVGQDDP